LVRGMIAAPPGRTAVAVGVRRRFAPHQLRHAHAVELARDGVPLLVSSAADELPRARPRREHDRQPVPARRDHQDRLRARAQAARRGRLALPQDPRVGKALLERHDRQPAEAVAIAWSAQRRLHRTWMRLEARAKRRTLIAIAAARELAGFCWATARIE
jgi:hypothetical protein